MEETKAEKETRLKKEYLVEYLEKHLKGFSKRADYNRVASIRQHGIVTFLGAAITILSGLNINIQKVDNIIRIIVLVLGAIVTAIGAYKTFFNNKDLWIENTMTSNKLRKIENDYNFFMTGKELKDVTVADIEGFKDEIDKILNEANDYWKTTRQKE
ncbi:SLATT domain-containing protein [Tenacibaculum agarivorans]|uniref:SLATT domain-containing protein n=1 Tax=Tenacibaculum agarivorans TaxID=1908389 RepID=UPI000A7FB63C|nr:DUF4231 domain-containing protein [Tenacibaculum agarivorans]